MNSEASVQQDILSDIDWTPSDNSAQAGTKVKDGIVTVTGLRSDFAEKPDAEGAFQGGMRARTVLTWLASAAVFAFIWLLARSHYFTAGDNVGYNLGLVGGIMMLVLLLYPLRKRVRALKSVGPITHWFSMHMALGIAGPMLILVHSKFHLGSLNASIAFWCMLLVVASGIIGRFLYRKIHHGLYGRQTTLTEIKEGAGLHEDEVKTWVTLLPRVQDVFAKFSSYADSVLRDGTSNPLRFIGLNIAASKAIRSAEAALHKELPHAATERGWDHATLQRRLAKGDRLIVGYIGGTRDIAQFSAYERLFALWHIAHIPFVYMLVFTALAHVIAVHMY